MTRRGGAKIEKSDGVSRMELVVIAIFCTTLVLSIIYRFYEKYTDYRQYRDLIKDRENERKAYKDIITFICKDL